MRPVDTFARESHVSELFQGSDAPSTGRVWAVGPLMRAVADTLAARFNPVAVRGEISGFSRAASGHCYFSAARPSSSRLRRGMDNSCRREASSMCTVHGVSCN